jgi:hypothetical protein
MLETRILFYRDKTDSTHVCKTYFYRNLSNLRKIFCEMELQHSCFTGM